MFVCNCNPVKTAYYCKIFITENKAVFSPIGNLMITFGGFFAFILNVISIKQRHTLVQKDMVSMKKCKNLD